MKVPNLLDQGAGAVQSQRSAKRAKKIDSAIRSLDKNQKVATGTLSKRLNETGSRLVEVAAKTTRRFDSVRKELRAMREHQAAKGELVDLTRQAEAAVLEVEGLRKRRLNALHEKYWRDHVIPLRKARKAAIDHANEQRSAALIKLTAAMTKKSMAVRELENNPDKFKRLRASYDLWKKSEFEPKSDAAHAAYEKACGEAQAAFEERIDAAYKNYCTRHHKERARFDVLVADAKAIVALCADAKGLIETAETETCVAITITDSNGTRHE